MRRIFTCKEALEQGLTRSAIRYGVGANKWQPVLPGVYIEGISPPSQYEEALALVHVTGGVASHTLAAELLRFDSVKLCPPYATVVPPSSNQRTGVSKRTLPISCRMEAFGFPTTDGHQTLLDLSAVQSDIDWEQNLEFALRHGMTSIGRIEASLIELGLAKTRGARRIHRVLALRPPGAPPTESKLESLAVQLIRAESRLPTPTRQVNVYRASGSHLGRVDLAWPELGVFIELDGQGYHGQPIYDARRATMMAARMDWMYGRFTWHQITAIPRTTTTDLMDLLDSARRRPLSSKSAL